MASLKEELAREIEKRRTFAIISHPDAGKTTLTEKLLLYGGAIHLAGSIKSRKTQRHAVSDWMEIEKQRGISVTSSVLQFDYDGYRINILDTPGHQDFSEDTYRTLMAVDSAVMIIDAAKGVEAQTRKLFRVCRQRGIPIFTFVNKLDRFGKAPLDLMDELENVLGIRSYPMNWPIGTDGTYRGVYDREKNRIELFAEDTSHGQETRVSEVFEMDDPAWKERVGASRMYSSRKFCTPKFVIAEPKNIGVSSPASTAARSNSSPASRSSSMSSASAAATSAPTRSFHAGSSIANTSETRVSCPCVTSSAKSSMRFFSRSYTPRYVPSVPIGQFIG